jgi:tetratricopeptide (TPR) repeat protein
MTDIQLDTLEAKGLIRLASVRPDLEYLFRHALVQDAAYGSLLKQERRELHGRVGEALEQLYPDRQEELAPILAMHFEQAGERDKAIDYFIAGGRHALQANAIQEAYDAFDRAAALAAQLASSTGPGDTRAARRRVEIEIGRAQSGFSFRSMQEAFDDLELVVDEAAAVGDLELEYRLHLLIALGRLQAGEPAEAPQVRRSLDRISQIADALDDPSLRAVPMALVGMSQTFTGDIRAGVAKLEAAVPLIGSRDSVGAAFARGALAMGYAQLGEFEKADAAAAIAREMAESGDVIAQLDALIAESMVRSLEGRLDSAVPIAQQCVDRAEETGASACLLASTWILGDAFHRQGRFEDARDVLKLGADVSIAVDRKVWGPTLLAWLDTSAAALGDVVDGDWDGPLETARSIGNRIGEAGIIAKRAESAAGRGDLDAAIADFGDAAAIFEELGMRPALARVLKPMGEAQRAAGRGVDADATLRRSLAVFEELGLDAEAAIVRTSLAVGDRKLAFDEPTGR